MSVSLKSTKNVFSKPNNEIICDEKGIVREAISYEWWTYVTTDKVGNVIFNNSTYSNTTSTHQGEAWDIMQRYGTKPCLTLRNTTTNMRHSYPLDAILDEIDNTKVDISELIKKIKTKGSWKKVNVGRRIRIKDLIYRIKDLRDFKNNYLDKKLYGPNRIKQTQKRIKEAGFFTSEYYTKQERIQAIKEIFKKYDKEHGYQKLVDYLNLTKQKLNQRQVFGLMDRDYKVPCINKAKQLKEDLKIKGHLKDFLKTIADFDHLKSCLDMLPEPLTKEHDQFLRSLKRLKITSETFCAFEFEKIHVYLINKLNRKTYCKKDPVLFNLAPEIQKLEGTKNLKLIKSAPELRREGKTQGHCIGSKNYIDACLKRDHQALNYKGYTFFLSPDNRVLETHGKYNSYTPENVRNELKQLIQKAA